MKRVINDCFKYTDNNSVSYASNEAVADFLLDEISVIMNNLYSSPFFNTAIEKDEISISSVKVGIKNE